MSKLDKLALALFQQLTPEDKDFVIELAVAMAAAQEKGETFTLPAIQKKEAEV